MRLQALRDDVALLRALATPKGGAGYPLRGAGFFALGRAATAPAECAGSASLRRLRDRVERERGADFLASRHRAAQDALLSLDPAADDAESGVEERTPLASDPFSRRYADAFAAGLALDVLRAAPPLERSALRTLPGADSALDTADRAGLAARAEALEAQLAALAGSHRPDAGFALLLGMARLAALAESLAGGRLWVLDAVPPDPSAPTVGTAGAAEAVERLRAAQRQELFAARRALARDPRDERAHARLEEAVARSALLDAALRLGADPRLPAGPLLAQRHGRVSILPRPAFVSGGTERWLARASARVDDAERAHARQNTYDVVTRNCVTELFREIELALAGDTRSPFARRPDTAAPLAFVPFLAERAVRAQWRTGEHRTLLSYRRATVAAQMAAPGGWRALLRESNTLTSALYQPHEGDSIFLFFTDDAGLARPLLGAANLTAGLVASVAGLLRLPFDGGVTMARGLRGSAASVPELFFANVRKGTFPLAVPADARPEDG